MAPFALLGLLVSGGPAAPATANAQQTTSLPATKATAVTQDPSHIVYPADFYKDFRPQTAIDMLARTPGFTLINVEEGQRGFGANAGNVLVDGQRPTVKTGGTEAVLGRIAAARVERIELIRGALTAEAHGQTLVANVVLKSDGGGSGNASFELRRAPRDEITPRIDVSYAGKVGEWQASAGIVAFSERDSIGGRYDLFDAQGALSESSTEDFDSGTDKATFTGAASRSLFGGTMSLNGQIGYEREAYRQILRPLSGAAIGSRIEGLDIDRSGEIGADWTRDVGDGWAVKLLGLGRTNSSRFLEDAALDDEANAFEQRERTVEVVGRGTIARAGDYILQPELGGEVAFNRLASRLKFSEAGVPVQLAGTDTRVAEARGEAFANLTVRLSRPLRLETDLVLEASRITVTGDRASARTLSFWKPSAALIWDVDAKTQLRAGVQRTVSQLDFQAFAATGNLVDDRPLAGNAELRPEVTIAFSAGVDHRFGDSGALTLKLAHETIAGALTYVPLQGGGEALTNFGTVSLWRLSGEATLPLGMLARGARLKLTGESVQARRTDPVTGGRRDDYRDYREANVSFHHDIAGLGSAYGISFSVNSYEKSWFNAEFQKERSRGYVTGYIETSVIPKVKTTITVSGISGERSERTRLLYYPNRAGDVITTERRVRSRGAYATLLFTSQF